MQGGSDFLVGMFGVTRSIMHVLRLTSVLSRLGTNTSVVGIADAYAFGMELEPVEKAAVIASLAHVLLSLPRNTQFIMRKALPALGALAGIFACVDFMSGDQSEIKVLGSLILLRVVLLSTICLFGGAPQIVVCLAVFQAIGGMAGL